MVIFGERETCLAWPEEIKGERHDKNPMRSHSGLLDNISGH